MNFQFFFESPSLIWGSCADWAMVFLTFVTAGALIWTLWEQIKINRKQEKVNELLIRKNIRDIRPKFKVEILDSNVKGGGYHHLIKLTNAPALKVKFKGHPFSSPDMIGNPAVPIYRFNQKNSDHDELPNPYESCVEVYDLDHEGFSIDHFEAVTYKDHETMITIDYMDEDKREYQQKVFKDNNEVFITFPKLIRDIWLYILCVSL